MKEWKRKEPLIVSKVGYRSLVTKLYELPSGRLGDFTTVEALDTHFAGIIGITSDKKVIIARQFRPGPEKVMEEIPGGRVEAEDAGDYEAAAQREFEEETGYQVGTIESLGIAYKDAYSNGTWHFYLATDCVPLQDGQRLDDTEDIEVDLITIPQLIDNARTGRMTDSEAVLLAYERLLQLQANG